MTLILALFLQCASGKEEPQSTYDTFVTRGVAKVQREKHDEAIEDFTLAIKLEPKNPRAYYERGCAESASLKLKEACADFDRVLELEPDSAKAHHARGMSRYRMREWDGAAADLRKAKSSDYVQVFLWLAQARAGKKEAATREFKEYLSKREPAKKEGLFLKDAALLLGEMNEADYLKEAGDSAALQCEAYFYAGSKRLIDGNKDGAMEFFKKCVDAKQSCFMEYKTAKAELQQKP